VKRLAPEVAGGPIRGQGFELEARAVAAVLDTATGSFLPLSVRSPGDYLSMAWRTDGRIAALREEVRSIPGRFVPVAEQGK